MRTSYVIFIFEFFLNTREEIFKILKITMKSSFFEILTTYNLLTKIIHLELHREFITNIL